MNYFFEKIQPLDEVTLIITQNTSSSTEADELLEIAKSTVHHKVLDLILSEVPETYKENMLEILSEPEDHEKTLQKLGVIIDNFEKKMEKAINEAQKEIISLLSSK